MEILEPGYRGLSGFRRLRALRRVSSTNCAAYLLRRSTLILGRDEAFRVLRTWRDERALLFCEVRSRFGICRKLGRLRGVTKDGVVLRSDGGFREDDFVLDIRPTAVFSRTRPPRTLPDLVRATRSILVIIDPRSKEDAVTFSEVIETA